MHLSHMNKTIKKTIFWGYFVFINIMYFKPGTDQPEETVEDKEPLIRVDYLQHFGIFFLLSMLFLLGFKPKHPFLWIAILATYAILAEFFQDFVEGRSYNPVDMFLNLAGGLAGILAWRMVSKKRDDWKTH